MVEKGPESDPIGRAVYEFRRLLYASDELSWQDINNALTQVQTVYHTTSDLKDITPKNTMMLLGSLALEALEVVKMRSLGEQIEQVDRIRRMYVRDEEAAVPQMPTADEMSVPKGSLEPTPTPRPKRGRKPKNPQE